MLVMKAIYFAGEKHQGQKRKNSGIDYIVHPMTVMHLVTKYKGLSKHIEELQCAALLHDVLEDTECTYIELEREFGPLVAAIVMELTSDDKMIKKIGKNEYLKKKMLNMSKYAFVLKLIDRLANISDGPTQRYLENTLELIEFVSLNREDMSQTQKIVIDEINRTCHEKLLKFDENL